MVRRRNKERGTGRYGANYLVSSYTTISIILHCCCSIGINLLLLRQHDNVSVLAFHSFTPRPRSSSYDARNRNRNHNRMTKQNSADGGVPNAAAAAAAAEQEEQAYSARFLEENESSVLKTTSAEEETGTGLLEDKTLEDAEVSLKEEKLEATAKVNKKEGSKDRTTQQTKTNEIHRTKKRKAPVVKEHPAKVVPKTGFNIVLTHATADFDSLASAVGLAKLWSSEHNNDPSSSSSKGYDSSSHVPTFVVLPRGAHPDVQRFLSLHKYLFPIRSLRSLPTDLSGLNRLGLVDAQRRDRVGPAEHLLAMAKRVTVVDHHIDSESDIPEATDYVVDQVGSVSTLIIERLQEANIELTEAEATLLGLGIHADTGSLIYDSTTPRDAKALAWAMEQGASQAAIAEHAQVSLSQEQQGVLTQALMNANTTVVHGVTVSTVLLQADGFINGLASVTQDAMELSSSDIFLLSLVYEARSGGSRRSKRSSNEQLQSRLLKGQNALLNTPQYVMQAEAWQGGEEALRMRRLRAAFDRRDIDGSGYLERKEIAAALSTSGIILNDDTVDAILNAIDTDGNGKIDFEEFVQFSKDAEKIQKEKEQSLGRKPSTMIIIGRAKAGVNMKQVKLNKLMENFGGGGHAKAASATVRLTDLNEAVDVLQGLVDELIETSLTKQPTVGDFMISPVLSASPEMTEKQVEDLFLQYDVRALPVVDDQNDVIGLVTYKEVAAAKQRLWNKEQKRLRQEAARAAKKKTDKRNRDGEKVTNERRLGSALKGWMKQHVTTIPASMTMAEAENLLLENDVGCIPVVADGTSQLVGMVTRTDLLRQHRYYPSLHYHNKGFSNSIAARQPIIELRRKLKKFDLDE